MTQVRYWWYWLESMRLTTTMLLVVVGEPLMVVVNGMVCNLSTIFLVWIHLAII